MKSEKLAIIVILTVAAIITMVVLWIIAIIGAMDITDGCLYRYNIGKDKTFSSGTRITNTIQLKANANYTATSQQGQSGVVLDSKSYGKWLNTNLRLKKEQKVELTVKGEVSLCKSYIPKNNLQSESNLDKDKNLIPIPRVEDKGSAAINLIFNATNDEWRNIAQLFKGDSIEIGILPNHKGSPGTTTVYDQFAKQNKVADCSQGKSVYDPICGRYSMFKGEYVSSCSYEQSCYKCNCNLRCPDPSDEWAGTCWWVSSDLKHSGKQCMCNMCSCYKDIKRTAPELYMDNGKYTSPWRSDITKLLLKPGHCSTEVTYYSPCSTEKINAYEVGNEHYIDGDWQNEKFFWFSADEATGLLYRYNSSEDPTDKKHRGTDYKFSEVIKDSDGKDLDSHYHTIIQDTNFSVGNIEYLQYRFADEDGAFANNTGGYVLNIKHTKCRRKNGSGYNDVFEGRGNVQYIVASDNDDPNSDDSKKNNLLLDANGSGSVTASSKEGGYLWLRINNDPNDYKDSFGQYTVDISTSVDEGGFYNDILKPFLTDFKGMVLGASKKIFKNMTCYKGISGDGDCVNFFNYIKLLLTIYIVVYGLMFLLGTIKISQTDLVIRIVKIALVGGLLNNSTFDFFNDYVFGLVTGFTDEIISNMSGYSMFSSTASISNPFMFLDAVLTKVFMSSTFITQILALLAMGINGVIYFILIIVSLGILIIVLLRSIAVYLMAFMAITVLIGLTPLFLTFILFERTFHLFDNWVKFMFRYMLEPVVLLAGVIILTQLITIYLDFVIGYSVCWKCVLPIKIPFPKIAGVTPAFLDIPLFCINWFAPWGYDNRTGQMGINMQNIIILMMLVYCLWGYMDLSAAMVARIAGSAGGPSATSMGKRMSSAIEQKALSKVGLDQQGRGQIKQKAKERLKSMSKSDKKDPIDKGNRHDMQGDSGASKSSSGSEASSSSGSSGSRSMPSIGKSLSSGNTAAKKLAGIGKGLGSKLASTGAKKQPGQNPNLREDSNRSNFSNQGQNNSNAPKQGAKGSNKNDLGGEE